MARMNLDKLSVVELKELQQDVAQALVERQAQERAKVREEMMALAAKHGFSMDELMGKGKGRKASGGTVAIKYRNPDNPSDTWTGRGRQPKWLAPLIKKGAKLEKFLIK